MDDEALGRLLQPHEPASVSGWMSIWTARDRYGGFRMDPSLKAEGIIAAGGSSEKTFLAGFEDFEIRPSQPEI